MLCGLWLEIEVFVNSIWKGTANLEIAASSGTLLTRASLPVAVVAVVGLGRCVNSFWKEDVGLGTAVGWFILAAEEVGGRGNHHIMATSHLMVVREVSVQFQHMSDRALVCPSIFL